MLEICLAFGLVLVQQSRVWQRVNENKNVISFNRNTTSTVTAIFLVCLSNAESHPVTELLNC